MNKTQATSALAAATTPAEIADLNDWAVNTIRDNYQGDSAAMVQGEIGRANGKTLQEYLKANRAGSPHLISRRLKIAVYVLLATR